MLRKKLRVLLVAITATMIALPELAMPVAAMPLAQPGARPAIDTNTAGLNIEQVAYKRKFKRGGYRYGGNRYWKGKRYGYNNRYWKGKRYGWNNGWCRYGRCRGYKYNNYGWYNNPWPWFAAGAAVGIAGAYAYDDYYDDGPYYGGNYANAHVQWCLNRYRSYDPRSNTYMGYDGYRHRCRGPY